MVLGVNLSNYFLDVSGLYALLALLPLIILYLIRPKPQEKTIPSLMFFLKDMGASDRKSFFKRFTQDWLFWLQLLTILLLALANAKPFVEVPESSLAQHTVTVLDVSASMQTKTDEGTRFSEAKEKALDNLGGENTIILAKNRPIVAKEKVDKEEARQFIQGLEPSDTSTAIYDAVRSALDYAKEETRIVVLSDFLETEVDNDVNSVKSALKAKGAIVEFIPVSNEVSNIGIVDVVVKDRKTSVQVRNYFPENKTVTLRVGDIEETLTIGSGSAEVFTFSTPTGVNTVELDVDDALELDNSAYISTPKTTQLDVLVITNQENVEQSNLWVALKAINSKTNYQLSIEKAIPPKSVQVNHDVVILKQFDQDKILPGVFNSIQEEVEEEGGNLIITPQRGMFNFQPLDSLLPVSFEEEVTEGSDIRVAKPELNRLTQDVSFGHVDYYFKTSPNQGVRPIAKTARDNGTLIAYEQRGSGNIFYYGIFDEDIQVNGNTMRSTFKNDLYYPIFWKRVLDILSGTPSVGTLNRRTGQVIQLPEGQQVQTPQGNEVQGAFLMDEQGIYNFQKRDIAANLINSKESDISGEFSETLTPDIQTEEVETEKPKPLTNYFIIAGLIALILELLYTKFRGDM